MTDVRLNAAPALAPVSPITANGARRPITVLVVDDDGDHRELITRRLGLSGTRVTTAATGDEAMDKLGGVDLVLLDYRLGARDGLEVLRSIRGRPNPPAVVMVTGMGSEEVVIECIRSGASDYVIKDRHYLANLPTVVERAWRHHDLERRAGELQRLALLVASAADRDGALHEVVSGALRLLAADHCELIASDTVAAGDAAVVHAAGGDAVELRVSVAVPEAGPLGELVVRRTGAPFSAEERELASTFASFAAIAISKLHQLELERALVAEMQQTLDVRRQLVAGVSHELRTPLTAISGFAQTLLMHWDRLADGDRRDMIERVRVNSHELTSLVEQLLDFASIEAGRVSVDLAAAEIAPVLSQTVADLAPLLADRTVVVDGADGLAIHGDAVLVRRILYNLLTNAAKYTPADAAIAVRAYAVGDDRVRIEVADTGDGMDAGDAARVFEPFWRAEGTRSHHRGTGIGLALVRDYVRLMGGELGVDTARGEGAVFWFTLPRAA